MIASKSHGESKRPILRHGFPNLACKMSHKINGHENNEHDENIYQMQSSKTNKIVAEIGAWLSQSVFCFVSRDGTMEEVNFFQMVM